MDAAVQQALRSGVVIPAHPLALNAQRKLDERRQVALTRYYCDAGAGGIAVGVHTTQFAIRNPQIGLFQPVLGLAAQAASEFERRSGKRLVKVAGICGRTPQAAAEAEFARGAGYDLGLLSLAALPAAPDAELLDHCRAVARIIPLCGFYLQPSVGGRPLSYEFWRAFCAIEAVAAIKVAPFNRYQTLDVLRGVLDSGRADRIALYTGNDDNIIPDLLSDFRLCGGTLNFRGGLLGQWAVWTRRAVEMLDRIHRCRQANGAGAAEILAQSAALTDANAALFDVRHGFAGCIAGLHEILRRQGLLEGRWCLDPAEDLSPGQIEQIDRVTSAYPQLADDDFVTSRLDGWLS
ncbi:MAG: dihydrodipicolinate synthase family protein [Candidatus Sulfopaludibacter sp.]|nr:dihydrodipicolinate synthase family protein [Candidatus Sulfopaludibacter sp.]